MGSVPDWAGDIPGDPREPSCPEPVPAMAAAAAREEAMNALLLCLPSVPSSEGEACKASSDHIRAEIGARHPIHCVCELQDAAAGPSATEYEGWWRTSLGWGFVRGHAKLAAHSHGHTRALCVLCCRSPCPAHIHLHIIQYTTHRVKVYE